MPTYSVDVFGPDPNPENFQNIEAEDKQEAKQKARELSTKRMIMNVEASEMATRY